MKPQRPLSGYLPRSYHQRCSTAMNDPLNNFRRSQDEQYKKKRRMNKEKNSTRFALLGTKKELTNGNREEAHLEKSMNNLRMRSSYSSGFGATTQSFFATTHATTKAPLESPNGKSKTKMSLKVLKPKPRKSCKNMSSKVLNPKNEETRVSNDNSPSLVVFEEPESSSKHSKCDELRLPIKKKKTIKHSNDIVADSNSHRSENQPSSEINSNRTNNRNMLRESYNKMPRMSKIERNVTRCLKPALKKRKVKKIKKPPLVPKNPLWTEIKLKDDLKYICRLNNHLTNEEINERTAFQSSHRISCNTFVVNKQIKIPNVLARDVYEKVVYDVVRREQENKDQKDKEKQKEDPQKSKNKLTKAEMQMLNVLIPKNKRKDKDKKSVQLESSNNEISKKHLGLSKYEDWYEVLFSLSST
ncbi:unnamed protein product [Moneuplotes crassus]|uniref:Uncharacterized protein n=1 Tax=Euplotes crassus TaxID=5936 RepID=A0AAD1Y0N8_EUPCR|nr:unnamed protein product [Moneuplotes crassus]